MDLNKKSLLVLLLLISQISFGQISPNKYWVSFTDKDNNIYSLDAPDNFLTQRSLDRRDAQGIELDMRDLPVTQSYIDQVEAIDGVEVLYSSRWFNAVAIYSENTDVNSVLSALSFVSNVRSHYSYPKDDFDWDVNEERFVNSAASTRQQANYGLSFNQIDMLNGIALHDAGFEGQGMLIGLCDAGFRSVDQLLAFEALFAENRIRTKDFVFGNPDVYEDWTSTHGMFVLSTIAGILPDSAYGSATKADFVLIRTEDIGSEYLVEEFNWIAGAEYADSLGVDVLSTSLGYTEFNDTTQNYTYEDLDGDTGWMTRASDIAASRGMLVINSAGNSGANPWHYIGIAADGDSVLAIGAVDAMGVHAPFSSFGPSSDGRVKPNVMAQGAQTVICDFDNTPRTGSGTSFSGPLLAGMATCLWQMHPEANNMEVFHAIEESANLYETPNDSMGFGIPDFWAAHLILQVVGLDTDLLEVDMSVYPNPSSGDIHLSSSAFEYADGEELVVRVIDSKGALVWIESYTANSIGDGVEVDLNNLKHGAYQIILNGKSLRAEKQIVISN